jgi:hypothetical protein
MNGISPLHLRFAKLRLNLGSSAIGEFLIRASVIYNDGVSTLPSLTRAAYLQAT